jgi:hypothetical protein
MRNPNFNSKSPNSQPIRQKIAEISEYENWKKREKSKIKQGEPRIHDSIPAIRKKRIKIKNYPMNTMARDTK